MTKSRGILAPRQHWSDSQISELIARYPHHKTASVAEVLGMPVYSVNHKAYALGLKKSDEYLSSPEACRLNAGQGGQTRFKPGHATWNKGKPHPSTGRATETQFKAGQRPHTWNPIGTERLVEGYLQRKMTDTGNTGRDYRMVHVMRWEEANGPLPAGHVVVFKDKNKENIVLDNLEIVTRAELMKRNSYHNYGKDIAQLYQLKGQVTRQINKKEKSK